MLTGSKPSHNTNYQYINSSDYRNVSHEGCYNGATVGDSWRVGWGWGMILDIFEYQQGGLLWYDGHHSPMMFLLLY